MLSDGGVTPATTFRAKAGRVVQKVVPNLDERQWNRKRNSEVTDLEASRDYAGRLRNVAMAAMPRRARLVIVPQEGTSFDSWKAAGGNFFFEITQAAREYLGDATVDVFSLNPGEDVANWHERLIRYLVDTEATHVMAMVESDPDRAGTWNWDVFWKQLSSRWNGVFLGVMYDSAFRWIIIPTRRIARINDRFVVVDICMPMDGSMVKGRSEVGPVNMPISNLTTNLIDERTAGLPRTYDVSFLGSLYPYRIEMIDALRARGVNVAVNPHHGAVTSRNLAESRAHQPDYVDYLTGFAQSQMTINFARSSAGDVFQLKTRVLEASLFGCLVLTDDVDRTERFWIPGEEYGYFASPADIPDLVTSLLENPERLARMQQAGRERARSINVSSFWGGVEEGLRRRGLPQLIG
jgi:hypothetical protein